MVQMMCNIEGYRYYIIQEKEEYFLFSLRKKITTLFWIAVGGLVLTTIYTAVLAQQGVETKKMITYNYKSNKHKNQSEDEQDENASV